MPWHGLTLLQRWEELSTGAITVRGDGRQRVVALTFDDGPDPRYTPQVLAILRRHHTRATFFVCGSMARAHPELVRQIASDGHVLGNHTETHGHVEADTAALAAREIQECDDAIRAAAGVTPTLFRPPRGYWNSAVFEEARRRGKQIVLWSLAFDRDSVPDKSVLMRRIVRLARPGDILLLHDGTFSPRDLRRGTVEELDALLTGLERRGFRFVTVPDLMRDSGAT